MRAKRILVIEDEFLVAIEIVAELERAGFTEVRRHRARGRR